MGSSASRSSWSISASVSASGSASKSSPRSRSSSFLMSFSLVMRQVARGHSNAISQTEITQEKSLSEIFIDLEFRIENRCAALLFLLLKLNLAVLHFNADDRARLPGLSGQKLNAVFGMKAE